MAVSPSSVIDRIEAERDEARAEATRLRVLLVAARPSVAAHEDERGPSPTLQALLGRIDDELARPTTSDAGAARAAAR